MCVLFSFFVTETNVELDSVSLKKFSGINGDRFVPNLLCELRLCHQMW